MKIDTSAIEGFDAMTPEQKLEAVMGIEIPDPVDLNGYVKKDLFDAKASEAASLSKKLRARQSDEEAKAEQQAANEKALEDKCAELLRKSTIMENTARYLAMPGFDEKLARETAEAMYDSDMDKVFANQKLAADNHEKKLKADLLKSTPRPAGAGGEGDKTPENVELAKKFGETRANALKASEDVLKNYL